MQQHDPKPATIARRWPHSILVLSALVLALVLHTSGAQAQSFDSGSDGSDGALDFSSEPSGTTIIFDPRELGLDPDGDNVYHFTTITIPQGVTVRLLGSRLNMRPVIWLASGAVTINGILDLGGQRGHLAQDLADDRFPSEPGPGGYPGGVGSRGNSPAQPGSGPGGGGAAVDPNGTGGSGGYAVAGADGTGLAGGSGGPAYGNTFLVPLLGGSGGRGSFSTTNPSLGRGGGGAGGGAILIASSESITLLSGAAGRIKAEGGADGEGDNDGGGSGGAIHLKAPVIMGNSRGILSQAPLLAQGRGGGSPGRIRIETVDNGIFNPDTFAIPTAIYASLTPVILPSKPPLIRVTSVAGVAVPLNPTGDVVMPDVAIDSNDPVPVMIQAQNIPPGTIAEFHVISEDGDDQIVSAELTGTMELSEATMNVTFPINFSRAFVWADYTP